MSTHVGKIGRLPKCTRDELGRRIEDGEPGVAIVEWLHGLPGVQKVLMEQFGGRPITEQNLSEWKQTGHPEWVRREETRLLAAQLTETSDDLAVAAKGQDISDRLARVLAAEMTRLAMILLEKETDPEKRWQRLCEVNRELSQLRRDDHRARQTAIKREQWQHQLEQEKKAENEREETAYKAKLIDAVYAPMRNKAVAETFGGGEMGKRAAEALHRIKFDLPLDDMLDMTGAPKRDADRVQPNPT